MTFRTIRRTDWDVVEFPNPPRKGFDFVGPTHTTEDDAAKWAEAHIDKNDSVWFDEVLHSRRFGPKVRNAIMNVILDRWTLTKAAKTNKLDLGQLSRSMSSIRVALNTCPCCGATLPVRY